MSRTGILRGPNAVEALRSGLGARQMIVMVHASWCGHCVRFLPTFREALDSMPRGTVIELEDSDLDRASRAHPMAPDVLKAASAYPTLMFVDVLQGGREIKVVIFDRERTVDQVRDFVRRHFARPTRRSRAL